MNTSVIIWLGISNGAAALGVLIYSRGRLPPRDGKLRVPRLGLALLFLATILAYAFVPQWPAWPTSAVLLIFWPIIAVDFYLHKKTQSGT
jgi:hypothetical protein